MICSERVNLFQRMQKASWNWKKDEIKSIDSRVARAQRNQMAGKGESTEQHFNLECERE